MKSPTFVEHGPHPGAGQLDSFGFPTSPQELPPPPPPATLSLYIHIYICVYIYIYIASLFEFPKYRTARTALHWGRLLFMGRGVHCRDPFLEVPLRRGLQDLGWLLKNPARHGPKLLIPWECRYYVIFRSRRIRSCRIFSINSRDVPPKP